MVLRLSAAKERELLLTLVDYLRRQIHDAVTSSDRADARALLTELKILLGLVAKPGTLTLAEAIAAGNLRQEKDTNNFECVRPFTLETSDDVQRVVVVRIGSVPVYVEWNGPTDVVLNQTLTINEL